MDPDERRRLILDAARRAFAAQSYEDVSLSAIAREARASEALVHKYFSTKGRLYGQVLVRDHVRPSVGVYLDFIAERAPGWAAYQMLAGHEPSEAAEVRRRAREVSVDALRDLLGGADDARTTFARWGFRGFLEAVCLEWVARDCPASDRPALTDAALGCLEGALGATSLDR